MQAPEVHFIEYQRYSSESGDGYCPNSLYFGNLLGSLPGYFTSSKKYLTLHVLLCDIVELLLVNQGVHYNALRTTIANAN